METKEIREKSASELNDEILDLDVKGIDVKTVISNTLEDKAAIENNITVTVRGNKELFKNETDRKIEIEKQLEANPSYKALKEQIDILNIQKLSQEARKKFLERELKIVLAQDKELGKELTETSLSIRKGDKERGKMQDRLEAIKVEQGEIQKEISKVVVKTSEEFKRDGEKKILELNEELKELDNLVVELSNIEGNTIVVEGNKEKLEEASQNKESIEYQIKNTPLERTKEEIEKQYRELIINSEPLKKLAKEIKDIQETLRDSMADREYHQRKIFIKAIERGIRI